MPVVNSEYRADGRTRQGRLMRRMRADLIAQIGGRPSATQALLIERALQLRLRLAAMDLAFQTGSRGDDTRAYTAMSAALATLLHQIEAKPHRPADHSVDHAGVAA